MKENFVLIKTKQKINVLTIMVADLSEKELISRKMPPLKGQESESLKYC